MHLAVVGADLLTLDRIRRAAEDAGASVTSHRGPDVPDADLVVVDLEAVPPEALGPVSPGTRVVGIYPHKNGGLAERARAAGVEPIPRSRFARDLGRLLGPGAPGG